MLASTNMVHHSQSYGYRLPEITSSTIPSDSGRRPNLSSRPQLSTPYSVENSPTVAEVLDGARKPSTQLLYSYKWNAFTKFASSWKLPTVPVFLDTLLKFLCYLFDQGLAHSALKIYVLYQPVGSETSHLFSHPTLKRFPRGLRNMHHLHGLHFLSGLSKLFSVYSLILRLSPWPLHISDFFPSRLRSMWL